MKYATGAAFRQALGDQIRRLNLESGLPIDRIRKMVAFDRFLDRLLQMYPDLWVVKGGFALQLRIGNQARTTKDIDLLLREEKIDVQGSLQNAGFMDIGDWFSFEVPPSPGEAFGVPGVSRFYIRAILDGRLFESFHIDVGVGDPIVSPVDLLQSTDFLSFAGLKPVQIPCYPVNQQIAEKVHAYTKPRASGDNTRVKDFVDILLLAGLSRIQFDDLIAAINATFDFEDTHPIPNALPTPPDGWGRSFRRLSAEVGLEIINIDDAYQRVKVFIEPVLLGQQNVTEWHPDRWEWR
ncbi:MAG: nucleotidyl transferase AbiEii/AbiGii toxin family protein [Candidatus Atribacteria bacterium]|nr:MAG: nucleotidyl transferase AbiEii/AbiGii toxin family protein [Candidatus Atribacteria bacterium]